MGGGTSEIVDEEDEEERRECSYVFSLSMLLACQRVEEHEHPCCSAATAPIFLAFPQAHLLCYLTFSSITPREQALNLGLMTNRRLILRPASYMFDLNIRQV